MHYLYTKCADHLFASLIPMEPEESAHGLAHLPAYFASTYSMETLLGHASQVHGLWCNVSALAIFDEILLTNIEMAWGMIIGALEICTESQSQSEKS
jgi:hypothetical protein